MTNSKQQSILIIGAGNMGSSIAKGLIAKQWDPQKIIFCEQQISRHKQLKDQFPESLIIATLENLQTHTNIILLAVKPNDMQAVCQHLSASNISSDTLYISIAAGVPINAYQKWLGDQAIIVRCMPNTPAAIGYGMTGLYTLQETGAAYKDIAEVILKSIGLTMWVDKESTLDAVTAISGSGPAYFFYIMECLQKSGQSLGLSPEDCYRLSLQTMLGAAQLAESENISFEQLRINVTSKGGTTEQAINSFIQNNLEKIIDEAIRAAADRSSEISQSFNEGVINARGK